jgi:hypothetical protein
VGGGQYAPTRRQHQIDWVFCPPVSGALSRAGFNPLERGCGRGGCGDHGVADPPRYFWYRGQLGPATPSLLVEVLEPALGRELRLAPPRCVPPNSSSLSSSLSARGARHPRHTAPTSTTRVPRRGSALPPRAPIDSSSRELSSVQLASAGFPKDIRGRRSAPLARERQSRSRRGSVSSLDSGSIRRFVARRSGPSSTSSIDRLLGALRRLLCGSSPNGYTEG